MKPCQRLLTGARRHPILKQWALLREQSVTLECCAPGLHAELSQAQSQLNALLQSHLERHRGLQQQRWQAYKKRTAPAKMFSKTSVGEVLPQNHGLKTRRGEVTLDPSRIFSELRSSWGAYWYSMGTSSLANLVAEALPSQPEQACPTITPNMVDDAIRKASPHKAPGFDGLQIHHLVSVGAELHRMLASLCNRMEARQKWPAALCTQKLIFLSKPKHKHVIPLALQLRPIVLLPSAMMLWSSIRANHYLTALTPYPEIIGGLPKVPHRAQSVHADAEKAFESIGHTLLAHVAHICGVPKPVHSLLGQLYAAPKQIVYAGLVQHSTALNCRGIAPGDCAAVLCMGLSTIPLVRRIRQLQTVQQRVYVDDVTLWVLKEQCVVRVAAAAQLLLAWATMWGVNCDTPKTILWATTPAASKQLSLATGYPENTVSTVTDLGIDVVQSAALNPSHSQAAPS
eukprot:1152919-Amphidinium_carterae.3